MTEFYDITTDLKNALIASPFVNTVTTGGLEDVDLNKKTIFPLSHIIVNSAVPKSQTVSFNISIIAMDIVDESKDSTVNIFVGNDNEQDVLNTQFQVLNRLYQQMFHGQLFSDLIQIIGDPTCEPFTDRFENKLAGWTMTFDVEIPNEMTICGGSIPSGTCLDAFIQNSYGSFTASLPSGSSTTLADINLQVFNSNETLIDEVASPSNVDFQYLIPDTIIVNSNNTYQLDAPSCETSVLPDTQVILKDNSGNVISTNDFPSCESYDLEAPSAYLRIQKSDGTGIVGIDLLSGSETVQTISDSVITLKDSANATISTTNVLATDTANITAPDGAITVNGSSVGSVKSNGTRALLVKLDGINSGTFDGIDTWNLTSEWVRPTDWLAIPTIANGEQVFYGLFAVYNVTLGNYLAFSFAGNYTVDWGDGTPIENFTSGTVATHRFDWANVGNVTSGGWRQSMVKVTPQSGQNITAINLQQFHPTIGTGRNQQFMDIVINAPNVSGTNLTLYSNTIAINRVVERIWIREIGLLTSTLSMFSGCPSLQSIPLFNTASVTNMTSMFNNCTSLQAVPLFNTSAVTNMASMFLSCFSLQAVPLFITNSVINMSSMFNSCFTLQAVPLFNTSNVTNMTSMFNSCPSLQAVPLFNTANVTNMTGMFSNCTSLSIVSFTTTALTTTTNMFTSCISIQRTILTGLTRGVSLLNCQMSATELNSFFTALGTASGAQTITVTGNPGASTCNTSIATTKGFTVVI